ncbi:MAG: XdhC family protein [Caldilineaceae bacterium]|nr:XdhC family protein [Caldilineaceae bacterium]
MEEVLADLQRWRKQGETVALATVVQTWGSSPRKAGAKMAITAGGQLAGSVSGGCVEGAVAEEAFAVLKSGEPKLLHFGIADETSWEVGLACGGNIDIFVEPLDRTLFEAVAGLIADRRAGAVVTVIAGPSALLGRKLLVESGRGGWLGSIDDAVDAAAAELAHEAIQAGKGTQVTLADQGIELFIDTLLPPPTLVMIGGVHIAIVLATLAKTQGYRTVIVDPRHAFGNVERFPHVDQLLRAWPEDAFAQLPPNRNMAVALLTHDPKIDDPALKRVLRSPVFYIGALGSRKTHHARVERLRAEGFQDHEIERIHAPIGLRIDAQTPEEIALAVMAEIVKVRRSTRMPEVETRAN